MMLDIEYWVIFITTCVVLTLSPGPDLLYVISRTITEGRKIGFASSLGVCSGALIHVVGAALGVSAIFASSAVAFSILKYIGAVYLLYLAYQAFKTSGNVFDVTIERESHSSFFKAYKQGVIVDVFNPKVAIFFIAFLPQFVREELGNVSFQLLGLGFLVILIGVTIEFTVIILASKATNLLRSNEKISAWLHRGLGSIYIGLGVRLALVEL